MAQRRSRRKTGARKRSSSGTRRSVDVAARGKAAVEERARIRLEIIAIVLIAVGAFLIFALFSDASGKVGAGLDRALSGLFGPMAGALPFFLIAYGVLLVIGLIRGADLKRSILIAAVFILFCILIAGQYIEVINGDAFIAGSGNVAGVFAQSAAGSGGGVVGAYIAKGLVSLIGKPGLYILCIALVCISGILLAGMSMAMATRVVREKTLSAREERQKRLEERRALYEDERVDFDNIAISRTGDYRESPIMVPSFLGGKKDGEGGVDKQQNILNAVKNDQLYGDHTKARGLDPDDTTVPFAPDEPEKKERRPERNIPIASTANLGKRSPGEMHYGPGQDDTNYKLPPIDLLSKGKGKASSPGANELRTNAARLEQALRDFRVEARVVNISIGPTVTRYEVEPDIGVKIQSIRSLESDLALKLEVESVRVVSMPSQSVVGIEAFKPNKNIVTLREIIDSDEFRSAPGNISFALGKNMAGERMTVDLSEMPHLLIAGTPGSGKSVCINSILLSILYRAKPSEVKLVLIDPKVVELNIYNDLPHLLVPVVTDNDRAATALTYAVKIMEDRYKKFGECRVNKLSIFNERMRKEGRYDEVMPEIVIVIDELADLMMAVADKVEKPIARLAQKARAAGMHLVIATQQPLASILTSVIKANIPSRIAFAVTSNSASRVILDTPGAERLQYKGDMLFSPVGAHTPIRAQGAFATENDVVRVVNYVKKQMDPDYSAEVIAQVNAPAGGNLTDEEDEFFLEAVEMLAGSKAEPKQISVSMIQRRFRIGYNRAARIVEMMEERGIVSANDGTNKPRRLIMSEAQLAGVLASDGQGGYEEDAGIYEEEMTISVSKGPAEKAAEQIWEDEDESTLRNDRDEWGGTVDNTLQNDRDDEEEGAGQIDRDKWGGEVDNTLQNDRDEWGGTESSEEWGGRYEREGRDGYGFDDDRFDSGDRNEREGRDGYGFDDDRFDSGDRNGRDEDDEW